MGSAGSVSKEQLTEEQVKAMIERFCYLDENNDGTISLEELKLEHRNFDGDAYDEAAIDAINASLPKMWALSKFDAAGFGGLCAYNK